MAYYFLHLVKRSFADFLKERIQLDTDYVIGDGTTMVGFHDAFPVDPEGLKLPAISLDFENEPARVGWDLGNEATYSYGFILEVFSRSNFEREIFMSVIKDGVERNSIVLYDYNFSPACNIGYLRNSDISWTPFRVESPGGEEEYRARTLVTLETLRTYY